jgi:hypothetical protein
MENNMNEQELWILFSLVIALFFAGVSLGWEIHKVYLMWKKERKKN